MKRALRPVLVALLAVGFVAAFATAGGPITVGPGLTLRCSVDGQSPIWSVASNTWTCGTGGVSGTGTTNNVAKWTSSSAIGNSAITDNGSTVAISNENVFSQRAVGTTFTSANATWDAFDTTAMATGVGGSIIFEGNYTSGGSHTALGAIKALKTNSTSGDFSGDLVLGPRQNGSGDISEVLRLVGATLGALVTAPNGLYVQDSSSPTAVLRIVNSSGTNFIESGTSTGATAAPLNLTSMNGGVTYAQWDASGNQTVPHNLTSTVGVNTLGEIVENCQTQTTSSNGLVNNLTLNASSSCITWTATVASPQWTGLTGGTSGRRVTLQNSANSTVSILYFTANSNSTAANRLSGDACTGGCFLMPGQAATLTYDGASSTWSVNVGIGMNTPTSLTVNGALSTTSSASVGTTLGVTGAATLSSTLSVAGTATFSNGASGVNGYGGKYYEWNDDWMEVVLSQTTPSQVWIGSVYQVLVSGAVTLKNVAAQSHPGILSWDIGTTTSGSFGATMTSPNIDFSAGNWTYEWVGGFPTLSSSSSASATEYISLVGFFDTTTNVPNQIDGCFFAYDKGNALTSGANTTNLDIWECWCASNGTRTVFKMDGSTVSNESFTTVNEPVAALTYPNTNIYHLKVVMTVATRAEFYVNGTKACDINTNVPSGITRATAAGFGIWSEASTGTGSRQIDTDYASLQYTMTSARSP